MAHARLHGLLPGRTVWPLGVGVEAAVLAAMQPRPPAAELARDGCGSGLPALLKRRLAAGNEFPAIGDGEHCKAPFAGRKGYRLAPMDAEILQLFRADCAEARGVNPGAPEYVALRSRDARRVARVMELLATGDPRSAEALHAAAWILNHGETAEEVRLGHGLALKALAAGHEPARWLAAATLDRSLMYEGK